MRRTWFDDQNREDNRMRMPSFRDSCRLTMFPEFKTVTNNTAVVTIEYCNRCEDHNTITRHDPDKYVAYVFNIGDAIQDNFPDVRVAAKPLFPDDDVSRDSQYNKRGKLGCFEVQVLGKDEVGRVHSCKLFSKLHTRKWPRSDQIILALDVFMRTLRSSIPNPKSSTNPDPNPNSNPSPSPKTSPSPNPNPDLSANPNPNPNPSPKVEAALVRVES